MTDFTTMHDQQVEELYKSNAAAISGSFTFIVEHLQREILKQIMRTSDEKISELKIKYSYLSELSTNFTNIKGDTAE